MKKLVLLMVAVMTMSIFSGCASLPFMKKANIDMSKYTAGNTVITDTVEKLDLQWTSGSITVVTGKNNEIKIEEDYEGSDDNKVQWFIDGTTLRVRYSKNYLVSTWGPTKKNLTVTIPEDHHYQLADISSASAKMIISSLSADSINLDTASGELTADTLATGNIEINGASGKITLGSVTADVVDINTASGKVSIATAEAAQIDIGSASGAIEVERAVVDSCKANTASGSISVKFAQEPSKVDVETASGKVVLAFPADSNFTADIDTASGKVSCDIPAKSEKNKFVVGDGKNSVSVDTASGSITITEYKEK